MIFRHVLQNFIQYPTKIFLIDSVGAFLTALIVGVLFPKIQVYIGVPIDVLIVLAIIATVFCIYSLNCYLFLKENWKPFLRTIAVANLFYCIATAALVGIYYSQLTFWGSFYFAGEIIVIGILVYFEFLLAKT
jgi:hypothetical protein